MDAKTVLSDLQKALPWIGAAATGNVPALVALAANAVSQATGATVQPDAGAIAQAVARATPEQQQKLADAENDFKLKMQALGFQHEEEIARLAIQDKELDLGGEKDARARDLQIRGMNAGKNDRADAMIIGAVVGLISCLVVLVFFGNDIPGTAVGIISTVAGIFGACLRDAFQFEFGSSRGSKEKDALIASQLGS